MTDFLIIGQGLAGTILSHKLQSEGYSITHIDDSHKSASSKVAAGIINPVTGRRFVKSWIIDELLPEAIQTYQELEQLLDIELISKLNIIRALLSIKHENDWFARLDDILYKHYLLSKSELGTYESILNGGLAYGEITNSYQIDIQLLIKAYQSYLEQQKKLYTDQFDYQELQIKEDLIVYKTLEAKAIIFCEGYKAIDNPYFNYLPFEPVKGEVVYLESESIPRNKMLRHEQYIVPLSDGTYWSGGGYDRINLNQLPTQEFLDKWSKDVDGFLKTDYKVVKQAAGVRPSVVGRRPLIGKHPKIPNMYLFNGMGTKGTSLAPYCAKQMLALIRDNKPINPEIDLARFQLSFDT